MEQKEKKWMVIYTRSRWEKKIDQALTDQCITSFCPLIQVTRKWADRTKTIKIPLLQSYLFVLADTYQITKIMQVAGVLHVVTHCGKPAVIKDAEIERIKSIVNKYSDVEAISLQHLQIGDQMKINGGPLSYQEGKIVGYQGRLVIMTIENLGFALTVKIQAEYLSRTPGVLSNSTAYHRV
jgi:transcription antitermination factor NusG